jgi:subtilisin family serine protease
MKDNWPGFSNWGMKIDIAAPGVDVLSLRARRTDVMRDMPGARYTPGESYVGDDKRYYRAGGTSFSAPIVSGVASLLLSKNPDLTNDQVKRMILHSAKDINVPGFDQFTGYGLLDAREALKADPEFFIETRIHDVKAVQKDNRVLLEITGTADANKFKKAWIEIGEGENPKKWKRVSDNIKKPVLEGVLASIPAEKFKGADQWRLKLVAEHENGRTREARFDLELQ